MINNHSNKREITLIPIMFYKGPNKKIVIDDELLLTDGLPFHLVLYVFVHVLINTHVLQLFLVLP